MADIFVFAQSKNFEKFTKAEISCLVGFASRTQIERRRITENTTQNLLCLCTYPRKKLAWKNLLSPQRYDFYSLKYGVLTFLHHDSSQKIDTKSHVEIKILTFDTDILFVRYFFNLKCMAHSKLLQSHFRV